MTITLDLQQACDAKKLPTNTQFQLWVDTALNHYQKDFELTIRLVEVKESQSLNLQYREKDKPTNVLSFPFEVPEGIQMNLLGDLVICADIVADEAKEQHKPTDHPPFGEAIWHNRLWECARRAKSAGLSEKATGIPRARRATAGWKPRYFLDTA